MSPCWRCGGAGLRDVGTRGYCGVHLAELYDGFDPAVFRMAGVGLPCGPLRPDWGPAYSDLRCCACAAMWTGVSGDPCEWCARSRRILVEHQRDRLLIPPDVDRHDVRRTDIVTAWAERLARGVVAGIVDERTARRVLDRVCAA